MTVMTNFRCSCGWTADLEPTPVGSRSLPSCPVCEGGFMSMDLEEWGEGPAEADVAHPKFPPMIAQDDDPQEPRHDRG